MAKKYYFLGICGISMSSLAIMLKKRGFQVTGSDEKTNHATELLQEAGINVDKKINKFAIECADVVVYSSAIKPENPQFQYAKLAEKKLMTRGELLGLVSRRYKQVIAVAGSHGKTTTTALINEILENAGKAVSLHLGGFRVEDNRNFALKGDDFFVTEACEYCDNFLYLNPDICVITNIEKEHMDYFKTFENQLKSFKKLKSQSKLVIDDISDLECQNVKHDADGCLMFDLIDCGIKVMSLHLKLCEDVNTQNCMFAYKVAKTLNIDDRTIKEALENFAGVKTRFEKMKCQFFDNIICDYAHHPTEIKRAIEAAKNIYHGKRLVVVFQPHTYSRTKALLSEFLDVFQDLEKLILFKTYSAREKAKEGMSAKRLAAVISKRNKNVEYFATYTQLKQRLLRLKRDVVLLFVGAGDLPLILHKNRFVS